MIAPGHVFLALVAVLADLQQQVAALTGIVEVQQQTLNDLAGVVQAHDHALQHPRPPSTPTVAARAGGA